jgi:hypothetical protein
VSKEINKLVDLEQADSVISDSRKKIRENTAVIKADKASIAEAEEELKESEGIEELFTHVSKTRSLIDKLEDLYLDIEDLDELIEETLECEKTIEGLGDVIESVEVPDISSYSSARKKHLEILTIIEQIDRIVIPEDPSSVQLPHGEFTDLQKHQGSIEALYRTIQAVVDCEFMIRTHNDELDDLSSELKELQEKRKVCPTCQRPL